MDIIALQVYHHGYTCNAIISEHVRIANILHLRLGLITFISLCFFFTFWKNRYEWQQQPLISFLGIFVVFSQNIFLVFFELESLVHNNFYQDDRSVFGFSNIFDMFWFCVRCHSFFLLVNFCFCFLFVLYTWFIIVTIKRKAREEYVFYDAAIVAPANIVDLIINIVLK